MPKKIHVIRGVSCKGDWNYWDVCFASSRKKAERWVEEANNDPGHHPYYFVYSEDII